MPKVTCTRTKKAIAGIVLVNIAIVFAAISLWALYNFEVLSHQVIGDLTHERRAIDVTFGISVYLVVSMATSLLAIIFGCISAAMFYSQSKILAGGIVFVLGLYSLSGYLASPGLCNIGDNTLSFGSPIPCTIDDYWIPITILAAGAVLLLLGLHQKRRRSAAALPKQ